MLILKLLLRLSLIELILSSSSLTWKYKLIKGRPVSGVDVIDYSTCRSAVQCAASCTQVGKRCRGFIYRSMTCDDVTTETGNCRLMSYANETSVVYGASNSTSNEFYAVDPCWGDNNPCLNGGNCSSSQWPVAVCECLPEYSGLNCQQLFRPSDCADRLNRGTTNSGVYVIYIGTEKRPLSVYCDMTTDGGGWTLNSQYNPKALAFVRAKPGMHVLSRGLHVYATVSNTFNFCKKHCYDQTVHTQVFQRRNNGEVDFYRDWTSYADGFGNLTGEFWLGNDNLHNLTNAKRQTLRIDLADFNNGTRYAVYDNFTIGSSLTYYRLSSLGSYNGTAGDSMATQLTQKFSTRNVDNDLYPSSCAVTFRGAWWYNSCHKSNLNGYYYGGPHQSYADGIEWSTWTGVYYSLKSTEMKIRPQT